MRAGRRVSERRAIIGSRVLALCADCREAPMAASVPESMSLRRRRPPPRRHRALTFVTRLARSSTSYAIPERGPGRLLSRRR